MKNQVIVQFKVEEGTDLKRLFHIEDTLVQAFSQNDYAIVDGNDIGEGKFNIYIHPRRAWGPVIERVEAFLKLRGVLEEATIAKFHGKRERYEVIYPAGYAGEFSV